MLSPSSIGSGVVGDADLLQNFILLFVVCKWYTMADNGTLSPCENEKGQQFSQKIVFYNIICHCIQSLNEPLFFRLSLVSYSRCISFQLRTNVRNRKVCVDGEGCVHHI